MFEVKNQSGLTLYAVGKDPRRIQAAGKCPYVYTSRNSGTPRTHV